MRGYLATPSDGGPHRPSIGGARSWRRRSRELFDEYAYSRPGDAGRLAEAAALIAGVGRAAAALAARAVAGAVRARGALFAPRRGATLPDFFARTPRRRRCASPALGARVRDLVRRAPVSIDLRVAGARDVAVRLHAEPVPRAMGGSAAGAAQAPGRARPAAARRRAARAARRAATAATAAARARAGDENPLLALWGRPGRDSIRLYNELSDCDFHERFEDPAAGMARPTLLATLQREVLDRAPRGREARAARRQPGDVRRARSAARAGDRRRRDLVAACGATRTLRFDDFAVVVPAASAATYLPLAREVFASASELPHTVLDLPSPAEGHLLEAIELLLALPAGPLGPPRSAAAGDAPDGRAPVSRRRSRRRSWRCARSSASCAAPTGARSRRQLPDRGSGELGPGAAAAGAGGVPFGAAQRRGAAVLARRRGGAGGGAARRRWSRRRARWA